MTRPKPKHQPTILVVDDEAVVTQSLAAFLDLETSYRTIQMQSPEEALERLKQSPVDLVISDYLMPRMNGLQFLAEVKKLYPDVPRIMLTGYADKENTIRAINEVGIFQYMEKPWDNDQMLLVIKSAIANKSLRESLSDRIHELDNVLLERKKLVQRHELLQEELALAQRLQRSMLPETLPSAGRFHFYAQYHPALDIGGDFYDVIPLSGSKVGVLVADATGHGIQAALSTAIVKFAFTSFAHRDCTPSQIIHGMNATLTKGLPEDTFVAALVATIDTNDGTVQLGNAGIPIPFVLRRQSGTVERAIVHGFMLGVLEKELYKLEPECTVQLGSGDLLLLYTDGISEAEDKEGEQFDTRVMQDELLRRADAKSGDILKSLVATGKEFVHSEHEWDDITLFGIEMK